MNKNYTYVAILNYKDNNIIIFFPDLPEAYSLVTVNISKKGEVYQKEPYSS